MNLEESKELIGFISAGVDNRALSIATATIWTDLLRDVTLEDAKAAVRVHVANPQVEYLDVKEILRLVRVGTRQTSEAIEADVRSAKARGMIEDSWPRDRPLPVTVATRLARAREQFAAASAAIESGHIENPVPFSIEQLGKDVPRE